MVNTWMVNAGVIALWAGAVLQLLLAWSGYRARYRDQLNAASLRDLQKDLRTSSSDITGIKKRLAWMEQQLVKLSERQDQQDQHKTSEPVNQSYEVAVNLVRRGADANELVASCGLSRGEAELISRMYSGATDKPGDKMLQAVDKRRQSVRPTKSRLTAQYESLY